MILDNRTHQMQSVAPEHTKASGEYLERMATLGATATVPERKAAQVRLAPVGRVQDTPEYFARMIALADGRAAPDTPAVPDTTAVPATTGAAGDQAAPAYLERVRHLGDPEPAEAPAESTEADRPAGNNLSQEFLQSAATRVYDAWDAAGEIDPGLVAELAAESGRSEQQVRAVAESLVAWRQRMVEIGGI
jgi:hypothetical protein